MLLTNQQVKEIPCSAGHTLRALASDGKVYFCHGSIGNKKYIVDNDSKLQDPDMRARQTEERPSVCIDCWARTLCGGDCYIVRWSVKSTDRLVRCNIFKGFAELAIATYKPKPALK